MTWSITFHDEFSPEFKKFPEAVRVEMLATLKFVKQDGPLARRPAVGKLDDSSHPNMKELRFDAADGVWRVAFAFDPTRTAILLCAGDKSGMSEKLFYDTLISKADQRYSAHIAALAKTKGK
jgi:hypothetical protein